MRNQPSETLNPNDTMQPKTSPTTFPEFFTIEQAQMKKKATA
jgi:hypothetical protein